MIVKFKEQKCSVFVFDGGYAGGELELRRSIFGVNTYSYCVNGDVILINRDLEVNCEYMPFKEIQTAVSLMQILIKEGLV